MVFFVNIKHLKRFSCKALLACLIGLPDMQQLLQAGGAAPMGQTPAQAAMFLSSEVAKWGAAVKQSGAVAE
jgi:hypothetical protein